MSYKKSPDPTETGWPKGIKYIIGNEGCERFSFYGMKAILQVYLVHLYIETSGMTAELAENHANEVVHLFIAGTYALPMVGAIVADRLLGKYPTILWLSIVYCAGHAVLSAMEGHLLGTYAGLALIALGAGGIKPCVSAHVGDQFGRGNWHLLSKAFQGFYFIINFGSFFSTLMIPWLKNTYGFSVAFAVPGILMAVATLFFWMGRKVFVHVPPSPGGKLGGYDALSSTLLFMIIGSLFFTAPFGWAVRIAVSALFLAAGFATFAIRQRKEPDDGFLAITLYALKVKFGGAELALATGARHQQTAQMDASLKNSKLWGPATRRYGLGATEGPVAVIKIVSVFFLVSVFWSLFDQHASSWISQAKGMDRAVGTELPIFGIKLIPNAELLPEQISALNPIMVMILVPLMGGLVYPSFDRLGLKTTPLRRMSVGMFIMVAAFWFAGSLQADIDAGLSVHVAWQIVSYSLLTLSEVLVSITGLEFAYAQAPPRMKSTLMGFWLLTVALGNVLAAALFGSLGATMPLNELFTIFAWLMAGAAVLFSIRTAFYNYREFAQ